MQECAGHNDCAFLFIVNILHWAVLEQTTTGKSNISLHSRRHSGTPLVHTKDVTENICYMWQELHYKSTSLFILLVEGMEYTKTGNNY